MYCLLNKNFGTEVDIRRGSLCHRYEVNRHDFVVSTNTLDILIVEKVVRKELSTNGYKHSGTEYKKDNTYIHMWRDMVHDELHFCGFVYD
jgi:hypothetical protein